MRLLSNTFFFFFLYYIIIKINKYVLLATLFALLICCVFQIRYELLILFSLIIINKTRLNVIIYSIENNVLVCWCFKMFTNT